MIYSCLSSIVTEYGKPLSNIGYPINTHRDEIGLIVNSFGNKAYYSSNLDQSSGKDIYVFEMPEETRPNSVTYMKGKVFDANTHIPLRAQFELIELETGQEIHKSWSDSISGEFIVSIPVQQNYMLNVSKPGYLFYSENFSMKNYYNAEEPFLKDIPINAIRIGASIVLNNIFYDTDSFSLKPESEAELSKIVKFLNENPAIKIEISGHTDDIGNIEYNQTLSENRAKTVADYLKNANIDSSRIQYKGYGMSMPVADNETDDNRAKNRRTELIIIE